MQNKSLLFPAVFEAETHIKQRTTILNSVYLISWLAFFRYNLNFTLEGVFKDVRAHCYCASLLRSLFIKHTRATSFSSARTESKTQQNIELITLALTWAKFRRRTSHEPNRMQMRKILCSPSLTFDSAHVKYGV